MKLRFEKNAVSFSIALCVTEKLKNFLCNNSLLFAKHGLYLLNFRRHYVVNLSKLVQDQSQYFPSLKGSRD